MNKFSNEIERAIIYSLAKNAAKLFIHEGAEKDVK